MHRHLPITALLFFAGACAPPASSDGTDQPPGGDGGGEGEAAEGEGEGGEGEGEVGEGEGEVGEGEGEVGEGEGEGEGEAPVPNPPVVTIPDGVGPLSLLLLDTDGAVIAGASVVIHDEQGVRLAGSTDEGGSFRTDVDYGVVRVEVTHPDYTPVRQLLTHANADAATFLPLRVKPVLVRTFPSADGGTVEVDEVSVRLPAGGYVSKETGEPAVGTLEVRVAYVDGTNAIELEVAPPLYRIAGGNEGSLLVTFGMLNVEMFIDGEPVDLGAGQQAILDMPLGQYAESFATMRDPRFGGDPVVQTIPTWWWDDERGVWNEEGQGQIVDVGGDLRWQGSVPHFTWWNLDWAFDGLYAPGGCPSVGCGTNTGRCQRGTLRCSYDGHFFWLYDGACNSDNTGARYQCQPRICDGEVGPTGERCNGEDDDCDGGTDEGYGVGTSCSVGRGQCRSTGTVQCNSSGGASCSAVAGPATTETCNGLDDDCDGQTDEGLGLGNSCTVGVGACQSSGQLVCGVNGTVVCSVSAGAPSAETCNVVDDNCDGAVDNGIGKGDSCTVGVGACAKTGTKICGTGGTVVCNVSPGAPALETCDNIDNDCDGTVDDNPLVTVGGGGTIVPRISGEAGTGCTLGSCIGTFQCTGGVDSCVEVVAEPDQTPIVYSDPAVAEGCLNTTG